MWGGWGGAFPSRSGDPLRPDIRWDLHTLVHHALITFIYVAQSSILIASRIRKHSMRPPLQPPVAIAFYRALLRSCANGRRPEVFGPKAAAFWKTESFFDLNESEAKYDSRLRLDGVEFNPTGRIPFDAMGVRRHIRNVFNTTVVSGGVSPFEVLKEANASAAILLPSSLPAELPIFDYEHAALIPGERIVFRFFEPRYRRLVEAVTNNPDANAWFLLRSRPTMYQHHSVLLRITQHTKLANGDYEVNCMAGPRALVKDENNVKIDDGQSLAWSSRHQLMSDDDNEETDDLFFKREACLGLLLEITTSENLASVSVPPIDSEAFSFWALRFVLSDSDIAIRMKWLLSRSTSMRLGFVIELLESVRLRKKRSEIY